MSLAYTGDAMLLALGLIVRLKNMPLQLKVMSSTVVLTLVIGSAAMHAPLAQAQNFPSRPIEMVIHSNPGAGQDVFGRLFADQSIQRNMKALGTFGYQTTTRQNPVYIQYMPRTLRYARETMLKYPRFARLRGLLATHLEEFR